MSGAHFFLYVKLLISLLNIAFFRLGENLLPRGLFLARGEEKAVALTAIIIAQSENPDRQSRFGEKLDDFQKIFACFRMIF